MGLALSMFRREQARTRKNTGVPSGASLPTGFPRQEDLRLRASRDCFPCSLDADALGVFCAPKQACTWSGDDDGA